MGSYSINGTLTIADGEDWGSICNAFLTAQKGTFRRMEAMMEVKRGTFYL